MAFNSLRFLSGPVVAFSLLLTFPSAHPQDAPDLTPEETHKIAEHEKSVKELEELSDKIGADVARMRALPFKDPVRKGIQSRGELREYLLKLMSVKQPKERFDAISRAYAILGLLPPGIDLQKMVLDILQQQVAGFYDPEAKALFLIDEWSFSQNAIIAHELTHAIQDQHYRLGSLPMEDETREDLAIAIRATVEGEGMLVMMLYLSETKALHLGMMDTLMGWGFRQFLEALNQPGMEMAWVGSQSLIPGMDPLDSIPMVLRESLVFPYLQGLAFVHKVWRKGGWEAVNALYQDLPQSTEQVMHLEKFFGQRDRPTLVEFADPKAFAPEGFRLDYHSVLGELYMSVLFRESLGDSAKSWAWAGWDGDHFLFFYHPETQQEFFLWATVWDSEQDAQEFTAEFSRLLAGRSQAQAEPGAAEKKETSEPGRGDAAPENLPTKPRVECRGAEVLILHGNVSSDILDHAAAKAWESRTLKECPIISSQK